MKFNANETLGYLADKLDKEVQAKNRSYDTDTDNQRAYRKGRVDATREIWKTFVTQVWKERLKNGNR